MLVRDIDLMDAIADLFGKRQFVKDKTDQLPCGETLDDCASTMQSSSANCMIQFDIAHVLAREHHLTSSNSLPHYPKVPHRGGWPDGT